MSINLRELTTSQKVELFKQLYCDITGKAHEEDIHLAHINEFERKLLISTRWCGNSL